MFGNKSAQQIAKIRRQRISSPGRLQTEYPAAGGGYANGTAAVISVGRGNNPGSHGRRRSTAGPAGRAIQIPGIAGRTEELWFRGRQKTQFRCVRLPHRDESRFFITRYKFAVLSGNVVLQVLGAEGDAEPLVGCRMIFKQKRDAGKRPSGSGLRATASASSYILVTTGIQLRIEF